MIRRILRMLAFPAAILLSPIWLLIWIFTGRNIIFGLLNYAVSNEWWDEN